MANGNYLDIDYSTYLQNQKNVLKESDTFKDYNYEGSNISVLLELLAYQMELNTYYQNKIVSNMFIDTARIYNTVHRLAGLIGYKPKGHISAFATLSITVTGDYSDQTLSVPSYSVFTTEDGLEFVNTVDYTFTVPSSATESYTFEINVKQGEHQRVTYTGRDVVEYSIILPTVEYDHDDNSTNDQQSIKLYVNPDQSSDAWTRVYDVFRNISGLITNDNVYSFEYNKHQNYIINFSYARNYPQEGDEVVVDLIKTSGVDGAAGPNTITDAEEPFIYIGSSNSTIPLDNVTITNENSTSGSAAPEEIIDIKRKATANINRQYRCVTRKDFNNYLESKQDINAANVWGENEQNPDNEANPELYNQIYISAVPDVWGTSTIETSAISWNIESETTAEIFQATNFTTTFKSKIAEYLETQKLMNNFENYVLPEIIFFSIDIGITTKRLYNFNNISNAIKNKLVYYFKDTRRDFQDIIDFRAISEWILDTSIQSDDYDFSPIRGINRFVIRDIRLINTSNSDESIYDYGSSSFPRFAMEDLSNYYENLLKPIELGLEQFPQINSDTIRIYDEG